MHGRSPDGTSRRCTVHVGTYAEDVIYRSIVRDGRVITVPFHREPSMRTIASRHGRLVLTREDLSHALSRSRSCRRWRTCRVHIGKGFPHGDGGDTANLQLERSIEPVREQDSESLDGISIQRSLFVLHVAHVRQQEVLEWKLNGHEIRR